MVVTKDGMPASINLIRSLDPGLDITAIDAAKQWRFEPGRLAGTPVDVLVTVMLDFRVQ
jgi:TonB family protein